jgi:hypothetical protein
MSGLQLQPQQCRHPEPHFTCDLCGRVAWCRLVDTGGGVAFACPSCVPWPGHCTCGFVVSSRPRPDFDPRIDYPERYTDGPI